MSRSHTISTVLTWEHPEDDELDVEIEVAAAYNVDPGYPQRGPSYSSGGEPGQPPMVEDVEIQLVDGRPAAEWEFHGFGATLRDALDVLADKLVAENEHQMLEYAEEDDEPDWDAIRDQREEDRAYWAERDWGDDDYD